MTESIPGALPIARPSAGKLFIRPVETHEHRPGSSIILTENTRNAWTWGQMEVIALGPPAYCEDADCERPHVEECGDHGEVLERRHPATLKPGDWILIKARAASETHRTGLLVCHADDVLARLEA